MDCRFCLGFGMKHADACPNNQTKQETVFEDGDTIRLNGKYYRMGADGAFKPITVHYIDNFKRA